MELQENVKSRVEAKKIATQPSKMYFFIKRLVDITVSFMLLLLLTPFFLFISYKINKKEGRPVFYRERRAGRNSRAYIMWRFRTMTNPSRVICALPPHPKPESWKDGVPDTFKFHRNTNVTVTSTGAWIRKYKLHKLPQLWNVLKGNMSLIGPKSELPEIVDYYNDYQMRRLKVKPGMTGYAQVAGDLTHNEKVNHDIYYIQNCSIRMDVHVLMRTIKILLPF
ncbi:lipopolysaccharide/colanic/teichoic acid biosynthesis glycosyltransferase [Virgibacillus natechei]|uniref:Lipopolysaccharide/colanic/teichoic acid biosynthesis glycosyltransferase n=1 Tax=Virgibacillus natechei TaxID=1216297 RepID=A0ABS4IHZ5_9BACI|nr:sugar transferase [Virgibacillus natechei]MBP1970579.1 lipopolysaccharide/colanic/teichoic acid biosynthesis glycosyltransferase [Virgibacillus natechei]UZD14024.1 sugar transferase [Virgibacillus natechei]